MVAPPPERPRRLVYLGTPDVAVPPLRALHDAGFEIPLVVSRADKRRGRGSGLSPSPVKALATELGIPVTTDVDAALEVDAELGVVVAFGRIIKPHVLERLPMVNLHFSLLPEWRGAAPVERAILAGDERTGVCLMAVEEGLDTGGVYRREVVDIDPDETLDELRGRLVDIGADVLVAALGEGLGPPVPQEGEPTYAEKIRPEELEIDWTRPVRDVHAVVRLGGAWTTFRGRRLKVHRTARVPDGPALAPGHIDGRHVGAGDGVLELVEVQPEGKARQAASAWVNGARPTPDDRLGG
ncbi:methionyl-tRNA formyltransferase [Actinomarinicola tropica]|uniref:methionyl-tRNA formyltransferase n=1 Tax=Actinomarinicola tropica TaxID=2789776 RepID=UPI00189B8056|nr:methionyl-tRNA formyltransferase [Actinomarinicola tropica]